MDDRERPREVRIVISFTIPGEPVPWGRTGVRVIVMKGKHVPIIYTPEATRAAEAAFRALASPYRPRKPLEGPLCLELRFVLRPPLSFPKGRSRVWPHVKPDPDNYAKLVMDSLGNFWGDDAQVCRLIVTKIYGNDPRTEVRISVLGEADENQGRLI
jgi:Holliday junction resolvase RusA-like endonuclease